MIRSDDPWYHASAPAMSAPRRKRAGADLRPLKILASETSAHVHAGEEQLREQHPAEAEFTIPFDAVQQGPSSHHGS